jgi:hypothetical protein
MTQNLTPKDVSAKPSSFSPVEVIADIILSQQQPIEANSTSDVRMISDHAMPVSDAKIPQDSFDPALHETMVPPSQASLNSIHDSAPTNERLQNIGAVEISGLLFILFPFFIILMATVYRSGMDQWWTILTIHDWALTSVILSGQTITHFIFVILSGRFNVKPGRVILIITLILMLFSTSLIVLILILIASSDNLQPVLYAAQVLLFGIATYIFLRPERLGYHLSKKSAKRNNVN